MNIEDLYVSSTFILFELPITVAFILWIFKVARRAKIGNLQNSRKKSYPFEAIQNYKAIKVI